MERQIEVHTERCILREMRASDAPFWYSFMNLAEVSKYLPDRIDSQEEMANILNWLVSNYDCDAGAVKRLTLSVNLSDQVDSPVGWVTFGPLPEDESLREIGYAIEPSHWGQGLATEAAHGLVAYVQEWISKERLFATVNRENVASIMVLQKIGMKLLGSTLGKLPKALPNHDLYEMVDKV
jgi:ribosomal-protein-alanine N-acetyltransferase